MSSEERVKAELCAGTLNGCLVESDAEENARERRTKRRALGISMVLQTAGLAVLVLAPLLAKPRALVGQSTVPIPPYSHSAAARMEHHSTPDRPARPICIYCPQRPVFTSTRMATLHPPIDDPAPDSIGFPNTDPKSPFSDVLDTRAQPRPPEDLPREKRRIHETHIDQALLTHRVEPVYPILAHQLRKSGKVELHAVIATDGSIQSLEIVSGDPLFINSAREAVFQWRYRPTYLNGQPVEIDTFITVIYTLQ
jgi:TonB family protein